MVLWNFLVDREVIVGVVGVCVFFVVGLFFVLLGEVGRGEIECGFVSGGMDIVVFK